MVLKQVTHLDKMIKMASKLIAYELAKIDKLNGINYDMWTEK